MPPTNQNTSKSTAPPADATPPNVWRFAAIGGGIGAALLVAVGVYYAVSPVFQLWKVRGLQKEMYADSFKSLPDDQRSAKRDTYRKEFDKLTDEYKDLLRKEERKRQTDQRTRELKAFFALSSDEQKAKLDEVIDQQEAFRKEMEKRRAGQNNGGAPNNGAGPGNGGGGRRGGFPGGGVPGGGFGMGGGPGGGRGGSDTLTSEEQQLRDDYADALKKRRKERGIAEPAAPGRPART